MSIDGFITSFLTLMYRGVSSCFTTLQNIQFMGTNLLVFFITIQILSVVIGIVLSLVNNKGVKEKRRNNEKE